MHPELVPHTAYPPHLFYAPDQLVNLARKYVSAQGDLTIKHRHRGRGWMGDNAADSRPDSLVQHRIISLIRPDPGPNLGRGAGGTISGISRSG
jgi:hypothetical protein